MRKTDKLTLVMLDRSVSQAMQRRRIRCLPSRRLSLARRSKVEFRRAVGQSRNFTIAARSRANSPTAGNTI
jgi:hypothetical protein